MFCSLKLEVIDCEPFPSTQDNREVLDQSHNTTDHSNPSLGINPGAHQPPSGAADCLSAVPAVRLMVPPIQSNKQNHDSILDHPSAAIDAQLPTQPASKRMKQGTLCFVKIGREEWLEQERQHALKRKEEDAALDEQEKLAAERKQLVKRQKAREKQQRKRACKKARLAAEISNSVRRPAPIFGY